jgi:radical SAM superfamily enzyme YgiQ (UPF0313 family)
LKIQLVHPPVYTHPSAFTAMRPAPPVGLAYIGAALRAAGHEVSLLDAVGEAPSQARKDGGLLRLGLGVEQMVERLDPAADALAVTNMWSHSWTVVREMLRAFKARQPDTLIVCGGEHFSALPELSMEQAPIDYLVMGEGEEIALRLFAALEAGPPFDAGKIDGLCWRRDGEIVQNARAQRIRAVDEIPWPAWDLFDLDAYNENNFFSGNKYGKTVPMLATRGCPYQCTYCSSPSMWTTRWYARDPVDVADEIESYVERYGANNFPFHDLTAIVKREWILRFAREIIRRDLDIRWQLPSGTRCEVVDAEVAPLLARSGCRSLAYAPESGSERTRKLIKKRMKTESLLRAVEETVRHGINVSSFLVIGFPHDTREDLRETVRLARRLARMGVDDTSCCFFVPLPSTELYGELEARGRVRLDDDFLRLPIRGIDKLLREEANFCDHLSARQLNFYKYWIFLNFYVVSFLTHPKRVLRLFYNLVMDLEDSKMDVFLHNLKVRVLRLLGVQKSSAARPG